MGKKGNKCFYPVGYDFVIGFFNNNKDKTFIYSSNQKEKVQKETWSAVCKSRKRIEPVSMIDGKYTYLSRYLNDTPKGMECDHRDGNPLNATRHNLRNCTKRENNRNRRCIREGNIIKVHDNKYIVECPIGVFNDKEFSSKKEADEYLTDTLREKVGEFSYRVSQEDSKRETYNYFNDGSILYYGRIFEEIEKLPKSHVLRLSLDMIRLRKKNGHISEECENKLLLKLINDYNLLIKE